MAKPSAIITGLILVPGLASAARQPWAIHRQFAWLFANEDTPSSFDRIFGRVLQKLPKYYAEHRRFKRGTASMAAPFRRFLDVAKTGLGLNRYRGSRTPEGSLQTSKPNRKPRFPH